MANQRRSWGELLGGIVSLPGPQGLSPPELPPDLPELSWMPRTYEMMRYGLLELEYACSPQGSLRRLGKWVVKATVAGSLLLLGLAVILGCASVVVGILDLLAGQIEALFYHLFMAVVWMLGLVVLGGVALGAAWWLAQHWG